MLRAYTTVLQYVAALLIAGIVMNLFALYRAHGADRPANCPPHLWCGCALATYLGITDHKQWRELWVARNWVNVGRPAYSGCIGCVAVLKRGKGGHVGIVKGYSGSNPIIWSGNHNNAWGTGVYDHHRVIAYRAL